MNLLLFVRLYKFQSAPLSQERPYQLDSTASRLLSEVKQARVCLVLRWGTTLESQMLFFLLILHHDLLAHIMEYDGGGPR